MFLKFRVFDGENIVKISRGIDNTYLAIGLFLTIITLIIYSMYSPVYFISGTLCTCVLLILLFLFTDTIQRQIVRLVANRGIVTSITFNRLYKLYMLFKWFLFNSLHTDIQVAFNY